MADALDVGAQLLRQTSDLVHEADARGQHAVGGILGQFGAAHVHDDDLLAVAVERRVELAQRALGVRVRHADDDAVGPLAVIDRRSLLQELRVGGHVEGQVLPAPLLQPVGDALAHLVAGAHRNGGLDDDNLVAVHVGGDRIGHGKHVLEVGRAVLAGRRAHGDHLDLAAANPFVRTGGEMQAPGGAVLLDEPVQPRLEKRDLAALEPLDPGCVDVHAHHVVAGLGQHRGLHEAHITRPKYRDPHLLSR